MSITRFDQGPRMSQAVRHGDTIYLSGQVALPGQGIAEQTGAILAQVDDLLERAGSDRHHILNATIWLKDMADFGAMNAVWDAWIADGAGPARATCEAKLAMPEYRIEVIIIAAKK